MHIVFFGGAAHKQVDCIGAKKVISQGVKGKKGAGIHCSHRNLFPESSFAGQKDSQEKARQYCQNIKGIADVYYYGVKKKTAAEHQEFFPQPPACLNQISQGIHNQPCTYCGHKYPKNLNKKCSHCLFSPVMNFIIGTGTDRFTTGTTA